MAYKIFDFPLMNPLKPIYQGIKTPSDLSGFVYNTFNPSYNYKPFDSDFYKNLYRPYETKLNYLQKYQKNNVLMIQWTSSDDTLADYSARFLRSDGTVYDLKTITIVKSATAYAGETLYYIYVPLYDMPEGVYFLQMLYTSAAIYYPVIFEPIDIKEVHPNTVNIELYNSYNDQNMIYEYFWYKPQIRVKGCLYLKPLAKIDSYEDQYYNTELVRGTPFREYELVIDDIPDWFADKLNRNTICDGMRIDGVELTRQEGSVLEQRPTATNPLSSYSLKLRERVCATNLEVWVGAIELGALPTTDEFFIEVLTIQAASEVIRKGFTGKRNFIDYLNAEKSYKAGFNGFWSESVNGKLVFTPDNDYAITGTWSITSANILQYSLTLNFYNSYSYAITITPPVGTIYYATSFGTNRTVYAAPLAISGSSSAKFDSRFTIYFSDAAQIVNTATSGVIRSVEGNLPPSLTNLSLTNMSIERIKKNIFSFTTILAAINLSSNKIDSYEINNVINFIYDVRTKLTGGCVVTLSGQSPAAPPVRSEGMNFIISKIKALITTLTFD